jgi:heptosyltransferase II
MSCRETKRRILIRATNWVGDAVMSLPAIRAVREAFPGAHLTVLARASVADLYRRERAVDTVMLCAGGRRQAAAEVRREHFDCAILLPNSFDAALTAWMAGIPRRIGYRRDGRGWLLTEAIPPPEPGEIPRHERFYYLELLRRAGNHPRISALHGHPAGWPRRGARSRSGCLARRGRAGAGSGSQPRRGLWRCQALASGALRRNGGAGGARAWRVGGAVRRRGGASAVRVAGRAIRADGIAVRNFAGETTLRQFIDLAAACRLFLTNDSGAMHIASALGVPTVTVFGATDDTTTGPTGAWARVVREQVECSPCLLRACPIDHRCMTRVTTQRVAAVALELWEN